MRQKKCEASELKPTFIPAESIVVGAPSPHNLHIFVELPADMDIRVHLWHPSGEYMSIKS